MSTSAVTVKPKHKIPWWLFLLEGMFAIFIGVLLLLYPAATTVVLVQFLGVYFVIKGVLSFVSIFLDFKGWFWKLLIGLLCIIASLLIFNHPMISAIITPYLLVIIMALLAIVIGMVSLIQAVSGGGWGVGLLGLLSIALGFLMLWGQGFYLLSFPYIMGLLFLGGGMLEILYALIAGFVENRRKKKQAAVKPAAVEDSAGVVKATPVAVTAVEAAQEPPQIPPAESSLAETQGVPNAATTAAAAAGIGWALEESQSEQSVEATPLNEPTASSTEAAVAAEGGVGLGAVAAGAAAGWVVSELADKEDSPSKMDVVLIDETEAVDETSSSGSTQEVVEPNNLELPAGIGLVTAAAAAGAVMNQDEQPAEVTPVVEEVVAEAVITDTIPPVSGETEKEPLAPGEIDLDEIHRRLLKQDIESVEGIGTVFTAKLKAIGILTTLDLLRQGATRRGRAEIVEQTGISGKLVMKWVNNADLFRIKGIGSEYADLLEASGVDTVVELAVRKPENLHTAILTTNAEKKLVRQVPSYNMVLGWVEQARKLPRVIRY